METVRKQTVEVRCFVLVNGEITKTIIDAIPVNSRFIVVVDGKTVASCRIY